MEDLNEDLEKQQRIDEIINTLKDFIKLNENEKYQEARKVILNEYAHFCERKNIFFPTFERANKVFNIPPAYQFIAQLIEIQMINLSLKTSLKFSIQQEQMNLLRQNNSQYHILAFFSEWKKGDITINLPLETPSNESNITINKQPVELPNKKSSNLQKVLDITQYCNELKNEITISSFAQQNYGKTYLFVIIFCSSKTLDQFLGSLKELSIDEVKEKMFKKNKQNVDDDIVSTSNTLSLQCPVSLVRISNPTKFRPCLHLNCVDASSMFQMYSRFSIWHCPVCNKKFDYKELVIDGYIKNILNSIPSSVSSVTISPEGNFTYQQTPESDYESDSNSESEKKSSKNDIPVIDLTLDDDSDIEPPPVMNFPSDSMRSINFGPMTSQNFINSMSFTSSNTIRVPNIMNGFTIFSPPPQKRTSNSMVITIDDDDDVNENVQIISNNTNINSSNNRNLLNFNELNNKNETISNTDYNIGQYLINNEINSLNPLYISSSSNFNNFETDSNITRNFNNYNNNNNNNNNNTLNHTMMNNISNKRDHNGKIIDLNSEPYEVSDNGSDRYDNSEGGTSNDFELDSYYDSNNNNNNNNTENLIIDEIELLDNINNNSTILNSNNLASNFHEKSMSNSINISPVKLTTNLSQNNQEESIKNSNSNSTSKSKPELRIKKITLKFNNSSDNKKEGKENECQINSNVEPKVNNNLSHSQQQNLEINNSNKNLENLTKENNQTSVNNKDYSSVGNLQTKEHFNSLPYGNDLNSNDNNINSNSMSLSIPFTSTNISNSPLKIIPQSNDSYNNYTYENTNPYLNQYSIPNNVNTTNSTATNTPSLNPFNSVSTPNLNQYTNTSINNIITATNSNTNASNSITYTNNTNINTNNNINTNININNTSNFNQYTTPFNSNINSFSYTSPTNNSYKYPSQFSLNINNNNNI
ncbi:hypothetical protein LY90DRAFT_510720 [Neocallimastix californiae]|uniref:SP-RING-type domain-containing protein n=1 Tax=Neocallimastix californiae TaxID=1754190 RepID=A0A1Y2BWU8_9FUNG|nr:hypothetical protein LY90DRAFT_510720 [Neocallimastix californiae]|eukprot:ORY39223.1 hypothetical protein LY90DRAFT_510720 [Neocallimastix californiae]